MAMKHVVLPDRAARRLPFYLAMEEWVARHLPPDDYFFTWQVRPTVIFGRNQRIDAEVDLHYCRTNGIETYRRKSGGGCVFADMHNIMFSYVTPSEEVTTTFSRYTSMIAEMLRSLGLEAEATGRNDVLVGGRKVSGNAFYHIPGRSIVHGTMLYDTDFTHMANAITPSRSKLEAKHVQSVESHITTLSRHIDKTLDEFRNYAIDYVTDSELRLESAQVEQIEELSRPYYAPEWIFGRRGSATCSSARRVPGVGEFFVSLDICDGRIKDINVEGDFFLAGDLDAGLLDRLRGVRYADREIVQALSDVDASRIIPGLSTEQFVGLLV